MRRLFLQREEKREIMRKRKSKDKTTTPSSPREIKNVPKIPFNEYQANSDKRKLDKIRFFSSDNNPSIIDEMFCVKHIPEEEKSRLFEMKDKLGNIFKTNVIIDRKKLISIYRKGVSQCDLTSIIKEGPKVSYPQILSKKPLTNFMNIRRVDDNTFEGHYKKVIEVRRDNAKSNVENLIREVIVKCKSK
jgi:hypothetical protein